MTQELKNHPKICLRLPQEQEEEKTEDVKKI